MNEELNYNEIEVGQSSKGVWYCKSIKVSNSDNTIIKNTIDDLIKNIEEVLKKYNAHDEFEDKGAGQTE